MLGTTVLSDLNPDKPGPDQRVADWPRGNGGTCPLSTVTMTEAAHGVAWPRHKGTTARAARLGRWLDQVIRHHGARIPPVDTGIALQAGLPLATARAAGVEPDTTDAWIGATAKVHGLEVLTFNRADFRPMGIVWRNPMVDLPPG